MSATSVDAAPGLDPRVGGSVSRVDAAEAAIKAFWPRVAGTAGTRLTLLLLYIVSSVLTARVLGPDGLGMLTVMMTIGLLGVQLGNLGLPSAVAYYAATDRRRLASLIGGSLLCGLGFGSVIAVGLMTLFRLLPALSPIASPTLLATALAWIPFGLLVSLLLGVLLGLERMRMYNGVQVAQSAAGFAIVLTLFAAGRASVTGFYFASFVPLIIVSGALVVLLARGEHGGIEVPSRALVESAAGYGFRAYLALLFSFTVLRFDLLMVSRMLGETAAGQYAVAAAGGDLITLPCAALGTVLFGAVAGSGVRWDFVRRVTGQAALALLPVVIIAALLAGPAVRLVLGEEYMPAVAVIRWLLPGLYFLGINTILMHYFAATGMPVVTVVAPAAASVLNIALNLVLLPRVGIEGAAIASTIAYALMLGVSLAYVRRTEPDLPAPARTGVEQAPEDIYGHNKRLDWMQPHLTRDQTIVELGCGTGYMLTYPLVARGYDAYGVDTDARSIALGKEIFHAAALDPERLHAGLLEDFGRSADVIIASEVLEHIPNAELPQLFAAIRGRLKPGGRLFVTVPNGYGWFELEQFIWQKLRVGPVLDRLQFVRLVLSTKARLLGPDFEPRYPSTLDASPHVQRFTARSIQRLLESHGYRVEGFTGSVLFAGPFSNLLFSGFAPIMRLNRWFGDRLPRMAAGFYVSCRQQ
jgi:O-antigen/teichoic acid export membrane protein/SAM-dependent methyltransferase